MAETKLNTTQLGSNETVWTESTLVSGANVKIEKHINPNVITEHTKALWHFDNTSNADSISGATFPIQDTSTSFGELNPKFSGYLVLNAPNGTQFSGNVSIPLATSDFTMDWWGDLTIGGGIRFGHDGFFQLFFTYDGQVKFFDDPGSFYKASTSELSGWHHYAYQYDHLASTLTLFIDGVAVKTGTWAPSGTYYLSNMWIDTYYTSGSHLDEFRISDEKLYPLEGFSVPTAPYAAPTDPEYWELNTTGLAKTADLATVATTGAYSDLTGAPTIPTVNNATLTITQGGTTKGTFTANASSDVTIALDAGGSGSSLNLVAGDNITITEESGESGEVETVISSPGVWTQTNLRAGSDISFTQVPSPAVDVNTIALWHLDDSLNDVINGLALGGKLTTEYHKFGTGAGYEVNEYASEFNNWNTSIPGINFLTDSFTVDGWVYFGSNGNRIFFGAGYLSGYNFCGTGILLKQSSVRALVNHTGDDSAAAATVNLTENGWYHLAVQQDYDNQKIRFFLNGTMFHEATARCQSIYANTTVNIANPANDVRYDEIRVSNIARYPATGFTPFTAPYSNDTPAVYEVNCTLDSLPSQTGQSGKFLTTNGTTASWATVSVSPVNLVAGENIVITEESGESGEIETVISAPNASPFETYETTAIAQTCETLNGTTVTETLPVLTNIPKKTGLFIIKATQTVGDTELTSYWTAFQNYVESYQASIIVLHGLGVNTVSFIAQITGNTTLWQCIKAFISTSSTLKYYTNNTGTQLTVDDTSKASILKVYKNGMLLAPTGDFTASGTTITFVDALEATDTIAVEILA